MLMTTIYWLTKQEIIALHDEVVKDFGGSLGILNISLLGSAINRPQQLAYYEPDASIYSIAAAYAFGLVKNHCFVDGNKRTAFITMAVFLLRNGYELIASEVEAVEIMVDLAQGNISQTELSTWMSDRISSLDV
jgi:death-on-curing protein